MIRRVLILIAGMAAINTAAAQRTIEVVESTGEFLLSQIELPADETGSVTVKPCLGCQTTFHRVTPGTKYMMGGREIALADLLAAVAEIRDANADDDSLVGVFIDRASKTVTRVIVGRPTR